MTLVLGVSAIRETCELGAQCSGEAKVSIERNGPNGTFAGDRTWAREARPARGVRIPKDKKDKSSFRPLVVAKVESRIVQRAIHDVLVSVPAIQTFVRTPYSFGGIKKHYDDDIAAVPAAIRAVLDAIGGAK